MGVVTVVVVGTVGTVVVAGGVWFIVSTSAINLDCFA